jgi:hypothetical protein
MWVTTMRIVSVLSFMTLLSVPQVSLAQSPPVSQVALSIPDAETMRCQPAPDELAKNFPPRATIPEFTFGQPVITFDTAWPRQIMVIFDTAGAPVYLQDDATKYNSRGMFSWQRVCDGRVDDWERRCVNR